MDGDVRLPRNGRFEKLSDGDSVQGDKERERERKKKKKGRGEKVEKSKLGRETVRTDRKLALPWN